MEPPRGQRPSQGQRESSWVHLTIWRARHQPEHPAPWPGWEQTDGPRTLPRWKRVVLMHVLPVCVALAWQLGVVIGLGGVFLIGWTLLRLLRP